MRFITDGMLGKLTRWLRMLGYNVKYSNKLDDIQLVAVAKEERRILLTRDLELYHQAASKGVDSFYLQGKTAEEKLTELATRFRIRLNIEMTTSRCPKCNTRIKPILKETVAGKVEKNTFARYSEFWECPKCRKIYWQGAHWARIGKTLEEARKTFERSRKTS